MFSRAINENLQIQISAIASIYYQKLSMIKKSHAKNRVDQVLALENVCRKYGIAFYGMVELLYVKRIYI